MFGDILVIWNFFYNYSDLFKFEDIEKEEIYAALVDIIIIIRRTNQIPQCYKGPQYIALIQDMHQGLANLFLQEMRNKNRFETQKDEEIFPFFVLVKNFILEDQSGDEMTGIWTEFVRNLYRTPQATNTLPATSHKNVEIVAQHTAKDYNFLDYKIKVRVSYYLNIYWMTSQLDPNWSYWVTLWHRSIQRLYASKNGRSHQSCEREKRNYWRNVCLVPFFLSLIYFFNLQSKKDEAEVREAKAKAKELEANIAKEEQKKAQLSRNEYAKKAKDLENDKKEYQRVAMN